MSTRIEWCRNQDGTPGVTWNPVTGCSPVSEGCAHCYAHAMATRLKAMGVKKYANGFEVTCHKDELYLPRFEKSQTIFICSMSDMFHEKISFEFIHKIFVSIRIVLRGGLDHRFIICTKRPQRMLEFWHWNKREFGKYPNVHLADEKIVLNNHIWLGVTAENQQRADERIPILLQIPAAVHFVSAEPLLGPLDLSPWIDRLQWVIAGGETGPNARPMHSDWARKLRNDCQSANIPFFFKHFGEWVFTGDNATHALTSYGALYKITDSKADTNGHYLCSKIGKKYAGRILDGREWSEMPEEMPEVK